MFVSLGWIDFRCRDIYFSWSRLQCVILFSVVCEKVLILHDVFLLLIAVSTMVFYFFYFMDFVKKKKTEGRERLRSLTF